MIWIKKGLRVADPGAISRLDAIQPAFDCLLNIVDEVLSFDMEQVDRAKTIVYEIRSISARDALHIAVMERARIDHIMSFDSGFDGCEWIERIC